MRQKHLLSILLCSLLLPGTAYGCAKTPEQPIVREKSGANTEHYKEADTPAESDHGSTLAERLQVPEKYKASAASEDGSFQLICEADVTVPDVTEIPIYKVGQKPFDQEWVSQVTEAFFGDAAVYDGDQYFQPTKAQVLEYLNELKAYQAEGNLDPHGLIASAKKLGIENPEEWYSLQEEIASRENTYNNAPESTVKTEVTPAPPEDTGTEDPDSNYFTAAVEMDGDVYRYRLRKTGSSHMDIKISRMDPASFGTTDWSFLEYCSEYEEGAPYNPSIPSREKAEEMAGITPEQAVEITDRYMEKLGLADFSAKNTCLGLCSFLHSYLLEPSYTDAGYMVSYTRDIDGFPITDEFNMGGCYETMDSTLESWGYEKVTFYVNKKGLQQAEILNLYQMEEQQASNVELLSFPEIADIFEQILPIKWSGRTASYSGYIKLKATDVKLGYMRVYDPGMDNTAGLLVPVWDFFGTDERLHVFEGGESYSITNDPSQSFLTINAADGTVIDRGLGY